MVKLTRNISWLESATWSNSRLRAKQYEFLRAHVKHTLISRETHDASKSIRSSAFFSCYQVMSPSGKERKGRRKGGGREAHEKVEWREEGKWQINSKWRAYGHSLQSPDATSIDVINAFFDPWCSPHGWRPEAGVMRSPPHIIVPLFPSIILICAWCTFIMERHNAHNIKMVDTTAAADVCDVYPPNLNPRGKKWGV